VVTRNITFSLPADLLQQAKIFAAEHDTTLNALVCELLQAKLASEGRSPAAADRLLALAEGGPYFTGDPGAISREELYDRG
jgi:plasmid stability protein